MTDKDSAQNVIEAYRKRQQKARQAPLIIGIAAIFVIAGAALLIYWLLGSDRPAISLFATDTPTPTETFHPDRDCHYHLDRHHHTHLHRSSNRYACPNSIRTVYLPGGRWR